MTKKQPDAAGHLGSSLERPVGRQTAGNRLGRLDELPPQLRAILRRPTTLTDQVCLALKALDGMATTDELLVMVYRQTGRVEMRRRFEVALYNAVQRGRIGSFRMDTSQKANRRKCRVGKVWTLTPNDKIVTVPCSRPAVSVPIDTPVRPTAAGAR